MTPSESIIINNELNRMTETYGGPIDYGFTGHESYRVTMAIIQDREEALKATTDSTTRGKIGLLWDDRTGKEFSVYPGGMAAIQLDNSRDSYTLRAWHDFEIDNSDDLAGFGMADALTPEIEEGLMQIADEINALHERAARLMEMPGQAVKMTEEFKALLDEVAA